MELGRRESKEGKWMGLGCGERGQKKLELKMEVGGVHLW